jgi:hypothetical protein
VKTRIARAIGDAAAAALHERLVERALTTACEAAPGRVELWCAPDTAHPFFAACARRHDITLHAQHGADLGERMAHAFEHAHAHGRRLALVGSDCPALTAADLRDAAHALIGHDAVFAPAEDGGYVLVALAKPCPALFRDVPWGTHDVMRITRERAREAAVRVAEMRILWDVDRPADLERLERIEREAAWR